MKNNQQDGKKIFANLVSDKVSATIQQNDKQHKLEMSKDLNKYLFKDDI